MSDFHFVNKNAQSSNLSRSEDLERTDVYRHVQRRASNQRKTSSTRVSGPEDASQQLGMPHSHQGITLADMARLALQVPQSPANNRLVYSHRLLEAFVDHNITTLAAQDDYLDIHSFFWIKSLSPLLTLGGPSLCPSIVALAAAGLGQTTKDYRLIYAANSAYSQAVENLSSTAVHADDRAFAACLSLVMYQFFAETPNRRHLYLHTRGLSAILQTRGPEGFQQGLAHDLFTSSRSVLISSSLHSRKPLFIAAEEWRTTPWLARPKSSYEQMLDCLSVIPQIGQDFLQAQYADDGDAWKEQNLALLVKIWDAVAMVRTWFLSVVDTARPTNVSYTNLPGLLEPAPQLLTFPHSYEYRSLAKSNMCRLFWTSLIDLYNMLALTYEGLAQQGVYAVDSAPALQCCRECMTPNEGSGGSSHNSHYFCTAGAAFSDLRPLPNLDAETCSSITLAFACRAFARTAAEQVCMSLQYCILPEHGTVGKYLCIIPVKLAVWYFTINLPSTSDQLEWTYRVVRMLAESGVPFSAKLFCDKPYRRKEPEQEAMYSSVQ